MALVSTEVPDRRLLSHFGKTKEGQTSCQTWMGVVVTVLFLQRLLKPELRLITGNRFSKAVKHRLECSVWRFGQKVSLAIKSRQELLAQEPIFQLQID